jgi:hypothetical protein
MSSGTRQVDKARIVTGLDSIVPSTSTPRYISMKGYNHLTVVILVLNATTVTGSAITLKQASAVAATGEKALAFAKMWANLDTAAGDTLTETAVASNTFTTLSTNSKHAMYVIEVDATDLDVANAFDCIRLGTGDATAATLTVLYFLTGARFGGNVATFPSAIVD